MVATEWWASPDPKVAASAYVPRAVEEDPRGESLTQLSDSRSPDQVEMAYRRLAADPKVGGGLMWGDVMKDVRREPPRGGTGQFRSPEASPMRVSPMNSPGSSPERDGRGPARGEPVPLDYFSAASQPAPAPRAGSSSAATPAPSDAASVAALRLAEERAERLQRQVEDLHRLLQQRDTHGQLPPPPPRQPEVIPFHASAAAQPPPMPYPQQPYAPPSVPQYPPEAAAAPVEPRPVPVRGPAQPVYRPPQRGESATNDIGPSVSPRGTGHEHAAAMTLEELRERQQGGRQQQVRPPKPGPPQYQPEPAVQQKIARTTSPRPLRANTRSSSYTRQASNAYRRSGSRTGSPPRKAPSARPRHPAATMRSSSGTGAYGIPEDILRSREQRRREGRPFVKEKNFNYGRHLVKVGNITNCYSSRWADSLRDSGGPEDRPQWRAHLKRDIGWKPINLYDRDLTSKVYRRPRDDAFEEGRHYVYGDDHEAPREGGCEAFHPPAYY
eukprot:TRINITY_DN14826_c0_g1_i1.p1 TRINITY_DN14826_c0_g1~~TRINITY_DN14826_c0_g1_i1.p1  ORF type:complete len:498 (+),score=121.99 TRINITY_DN14826_c0_g1_i1:67-1560(+)